MLLKLILVQTQLFVDITLQVYLMKSTIVEHFVLYLAQNYLPLNNQPLISAMESESRNILSQIVMYNNSVMKQISIAS